MNEYKPSSQPPAPPHFSCPTRDQQHMVPREFDECFFGQDEDTHLRCATPSQREEACTELRFDLSGAECVCASSGDALLWRGNVIHWATRARRPPPSSAAGASEEPDDDASTTRVSIGCTFRARNCMEVIRRM